LLNGIGTGISAVASLAVFLSFTALILFFLLKDGPVIRDGTERHTRASRRVAGDRGCARSHARLTRPRRDTEGLMSDRASTGTARPTGAHPSRENPMTSDKARPVTGTPAGPELT
jgi:hypothetical protein